MALSEKELESRKFTIGSSDVPAILGISPFKNKASILADKLTERKIENPIWILVGNKLERPIAELALETKKIPGVTIVSGKTVTKGWKSCTPDFYALKNWPIPISETFPRYPASYEEEDGALVEVKNVGMHKMRDWEWGKSCPKYVQAQAQWQMSVLEHKRVYVVTLMGGNNVKVFPIDRDDKWLVEIEKKCRAFYDEHLAKGKRDEPLMRIRLERFRAMSYRHAA